LQSDTLVPPIVLIAAESDEIRSATSRALRAYGVRQLESSTRARLGDAAARVIPDVVLVIADQQLKEPAALIAQLRAAAATRDTPIVVQLAAGGRATSDALLMAGADRVLTEGPESAALAGTLFRLSDVTPERRAIRELRRALASQVAPTIVQLGYAMQQLHAMMIAVNAKGTCVAVNDALLNATAFSRDDIIGHPLWDVIQTGNGRDLRGHWSTLQVVGTLQGPCTLARKYGGAAPAEVYVSAQILPDVHIAAVRPRTA
jgi:PAS domain-containing protein